MRNSHIDVLTALRNFERLTEKPVTFLDDEIQDYAVTVQELIFSEVQAGPFLLTELVDILSKDFGTARFLGCQDHLRPNDVKTRPGWADQTLFVSCQNGKR